MKKFKIINISNKIPTYRYACAFGSIFLGKKVINIIKQGLIEKGDPIQLSEIAGLIAVKNTSKTLILCHPINIDNVVVSTRINFKKKSVETFCFVIAYAKTGVEMEAINGVSTSLMTIYDLTKKYNSFSRINEMKLLYKSGGENRFIMGEGIKIPSHLKKNFLNSVSMKRFSVLLVSVSNRATIGSYKDIRSQFILDYLEISNFNIYKSMLIPDDQDILEKILLSKLSKNIDIIIFAGSSGISKNDFVYNIIEKHCFNISGLSTFFAKEGLKHTQMSYLSYFYCGMAAETLIISLPGNPTAAYECLKDSGKLITHAIDMIKKC